MERPEGTRRLDDRGRITIERELRPFLGGDRIVQVATPRGILLRPAASVVHLGPDAASFTSEDAEAAALDDFDARRRTDQGTKRPVGRRHH